MEQSDLNEVYIFTRVVELDGFSAAAKALRMPKSTMSRRVSDLEARLGVRLLQRTTRKMSLTDVGREYYARTARIIEELQEADSLVEQAQEEPSGTLRITAPADLANNFFSGIIAEFLATYPSVSIALDLSQRMVDLIEEGIDLALRAGIFI